MPSSGKKRILFIDDEANVRTVVQACLETLGGWEVLLAASGFEGLAIAEVEQPDAILLDGMMPEMDGISCLKLLQKNPTICAIPVVFLTAKLSLVDPVHYLALGAKGAIAKPFNPLNLAPQIASVLGWELKCID